MEIRALKVFCFAGIMLAVSTPAMAQFAVESPKVEQGELEVEKHGSIQSGVPGAEDESEAIRHGHEIEIGYGLTSFWRASIGLTLLAPEDEGLQASAIEFTNILQVARASGATFGLLASVSVGLNDEPNAFEFGPLVEFGDEKRSLTFNAIFEKTFGANREEGIGFEYAAQAKFEVAKGVALGVEGFGEIDDIGNSGSFDETQLRIGPAVFLNFGDDKDDGRGGGDDEAKGLKKADKDPEIKAGIGVLFGATEATPDTTFKWDLEVAF